MKTKKITLFVPGLWALLRHAGNEALAEMPALQLLLKRSDSLSESLLESETLLLQNLGWSGDENKDVPVAALEHLGTGSDSEGFWFRADPVNLQQDQSYLMMSYPSMLDLELEEAQALIDSINQHFADDGWSLEIADAKCWYLKLDKDPGIKTTPVWRAFGKDIFGLMPEGEDSQQWHAWLMELQMLLFTHPVNEARVEQGKAPVTGLWLWGGGELPELLSSDFTLRGDSLFMQGVAKQSTSEIKNLPNNMSTVCDDVEQSSSQLIMLEYARTALLSGSMEQGVVALKQLEAKVFQPLSAMLKSKNVNSLIIIDCPGNRINISAGGLTKWWRRKKFDT